MARFSSLQFYIYLCSLFYFALAAPVEKGVLTFAYRDLVDLSTRQSKMAGTFTLPPLPYSYDALEPVISKQIMQIHHDKHHQTYVNNLNSALANQTAALQSNEIPKLVSLQQSIKFNGGGHINHSLFWKNLAPYNSRQTNIDRSAPTLKKAIEVQWGSVQNFEDAFEKLLLNLQGSGWGWLVGKETGGKLDIVTTKDQDPVTDAVPIFGIDMWEHAYYLQYQNNKAAYVSGVWKVINWEEAEDRYENGVKGPQV
ncbi:superoxide dismutase mitochondrial [Penicillium capsulatum]|uniref:Superoxide dismutase n=1 Tax=Penicillium capsulatum TaxID=69766 RepID=A0A9W9IF42_9EURO|nr:superoxide dismutase mitochondrial [Penicillium capsulatum]KAJ6135827.1 superoxide dismutase mitochondrial [Penicillium capsulatum]